MFYGLCINDRWNICDPSKSFAPSYGPVSEKRIFQVCLEEHLQERSGTCSLPWSASEPWTFWKGNSEEEIRANKGQLIVSLHADNKDAFWELEQWVSGPCTGFQIKVDY